MSSVIVDKFINGIPWEKSSVGNGESSWEIPLKDKFWEKRPHSKVLNKIVKI